MSEAVVEASNSAVPSHIAEAMNKVRAVKQVVTEAGADKPAKAKAADKPVRKAKKSQRERLVAEEPKAEKPKKAKAPAKKAKAEKAKPGKTKAAKAPAKVAKPVKAKAPAKAKAPVKRERRVATTNLDSPEPLGSKPIKWPDLVLKEEPKRKAGICIVEKCREECYGKSSKSLYCQNHAVHAARAAARLRLRKARAAGYQG